MVDFSNDRRIFKPLGGTDRKIIVDHDGVGYMLKFSEGLSPRTDMTDSYANNVVSEYISSHIAATTGLPTHETVLGYYKGEVVVGCKDFRKQGEENIEFQEFVHGVFDSDSVKRVLRLDQIYETLGDESAFTPKLRDESIRRYWDTFVVDALVGNFDRHAGNWGYISNGFGLKLAPAYDFGSTLLPKLSDDGISSIENDRIEMLSRALVFPSPSLFILSEKAGKVGYYDLLSSGYDENCTEAVLRMVPKMDMDKISDVITNTPLISEERKRFYAKYISLRKEVVLDRAYDCCVSKNFDKEALERILTGRQYSRTDLEREADALLNNVSKAEDKLPPINLSPKLSAVKLFSDILSLGGEDDEWERTRDWKDPEP